MHSIIYDGKNAKAVLALAYQEGLINIERDMDRVLGTIVMTQVPPRIKKSIMEQMVMFPDIILDSKLCFSGKVKFGGELIECKKIRFEEFPDKIESGTWKNHEIYSDISLIQKMLWNEGYQYSLDDMYRIYKEAEDVKKKYDAYWVKKGRVPVYNPLAIALLEITADSMDFS